MTIITMNGKDAKEFAKVWESLFKKYFIEEECSSKDFLSFINLENIHEEDNCLVQIKSKRVLIFWKEAEYWKANDNYIALLSSKKIY